MQGASAGGAQDGLGPHLHSSVVREPRRACPVSKGTCLHGSPSWQPGYKKLKSPNAPQNGAKNQALSFSVKKQTLKNIYIIQQGLLGQKAPASGPLPTPPPIEKSQKGNSIEQELKGAPKGQLRPLTSGTDCDEGGAGPTVQTDLPS